MSAERQRRWRASRGAATGQPGRPRKPIAHGERRGAAQHRRRGETPCDACKQAEAEARKRNRMNATTSTDTVTYIEAAHGTWESGILGFDPIVHITDADGDTDKIRLSHLRDLAATGGDKPTAEERAEVKTRAKPLLSQAMIRARRWSPLTIRLSGPSAARDGGVSLTVDWTGEHVSVSDVLTMYDTWHPGSLPSSAEPHGVLVQELDDRVHVRELADLLRQWGHEVTIAPRIH